MREDIFEELLESVRQGGQILRGERKPSRVFRAAEPDARKIRELYGLSQEKFAKLIGISVATLRNWDRDADGLRALRECCYGLQPNIQRQSWTW